MKSWNKGPDLSYLGQNPQTPKLGGMFLRSFSVSSLEQLIYGSPRQLPRGLLPHRQGTGVLISPHPQSYLLIDSFINQLPNYLR